MRCDETSPHCQQCIRAGRQCPGPSEGAVIIDLTAQTAQRSQNRRLNNNTGLVTQASNQSMESSAVAQTCLARFLEYFAGRGAGTQDIPWMNQLPSMQAEVSVDALELSVQAAAIAFCALESSQPDALRRTREIYGSALASQSRLVTAVPTPTPRMICTTVMMSYYEAINHATLGGYVRHLDGVAKMLQLAGPEACSQGLINQIFFTARTQMVSLNSKTSNKAD
jgi:hypothetical protein